MNEVRIALELDTSAIDAAMASLEQLLQLFPERVQLFWQSLQSSVELVRFNSDRGAAANAGKVRILAQPSDRLAEFLATAWAIEG
ncbi:hypothetical protein D1345_09350 [Chromobacterium rhizoryzae]|uniref:Uncharacterized protein n=1 Tax=Chromobacterium rhizoryzae TaxID=1778675 RepID=A0AAD0RS48_9NEIS|nr:hypothetical protein D1345_09350 [Chromobacterium rhizoryzae]